MYNRYVIKWLTTIHWTYNLIFELLIKIDLTINQLLVNLISNMFYNTLINLSSVKMIDCSCSIIAPSIYRSILFIRYIRICHETKICFNLTKHFYENFFKKKIFKLVFYKVKLSFDKNNYIICFDLYIS